MTNQLQVFKFNGKNVRTVLIDGDIHFVAKDVATILGYYDAFSMVKSLDSEEISKIATDILSVANSMARDFIVINESGLYSVIFRSKKQEAKNFKRWIIQEVLPSIRKSGTYSLNENVLMATLQTEIERRTKAESERDMYRSNIERLARNCNLTFGELSDATGLPREVVIAPYCKSSRRKHEAQSSKYIQLILPLKELVEQVQRELKVKK